MQSSDNPAKFKKDLCNHLKKSPVLLVFSAFSEGQNKITTVALAVGVKAVIPPLLYLKNYLVKVF